MYLFVCLFVCLVGWLVRSFSCICLFVQLFVCSIVSLFLYLYVCSFVLLFVFVLFCYVLFFWGVRWLGVWGSWVLGLGVALGWVLRCNIFAGKDVLLLCTPVGPALYLPCCFIKV